MLVDSHCHLNLPHFAEDLDAVLARAQAAGVQRILVPGVDIATSRAALQLADTHNMVYATVGVHPGDVSGWDHGMLDVLRELVRHPKCCAIGEIGLDYYRDRAPRPLQRDVLRMQLELAAEAGKPVVLHNRESWDDLWREVSDWHQALTNSGSPLAQHPGVLHSFDGTPAQANLATATGFAIGVSGPITYKNGMARRELAAALPFEKIWIETDAPYLTPHPHRGQRNEPAYVALVAQAIADVRGVPLREVLRITGENAGKTLDWS